MEVCIQYTAFRTPTSLPLRFSSEMEVVKLLKYVKTGVLGGRNTRDSHVDLRGALGDRDILYRTIAT